MEKKLTVEELKEKLLSMPDRPRGIIVDGDKKPIGFYYTMIVCPRCDFLDDAAQKERTLFVEPLERIAGGHYAKCNACGYTASVTESILLANAFPPVPDYGKGFFEKPDSE